MPAKPKPKSTRPIRIAEAPNVIAIRPHLVPAVIKSVAVIRYLNEHGAGASLSAIAEALNITRSHCHNILRTLMSCAWLAYDPRTRLYRLSSGLAADTAAALVSQPHLPLVRPIVEQLSTETGLPCTVCEPIADGSFLVVLTVRQADPYISSVPAGYRFPPSTAAQFKAMHAWLAPAQQRIALDAWRPVRHTKTTIVERAAMADDLAQSRARGYARSEGEYVEGFTTVALPVFDRAGEVVLIISCAGRSDGFAAHEARAVKALAARVKEIHARIDGRPPVDFPRP
jgi:DNA-binding IclR family transcriptional regulator